MQSRRSKRVNIGRHARPGKLAQGTVAVASLATGGLFFLPTTRSRIGELEAIQTSKCSVPECANTIPCPGSAGTALAPARAPGLSGIYDDIGDLRRSWPSARVERGAASHTRQRASGLRGQATITCTIHLKSSTVRPTSSGWRATCSASAFSCFSFTTASASPSWMMACSNFRSGGTSLASTLASRRSLLRSFCTEFTW
jgi:hypothetical protein